MDMVSNNTQAVAFKQSSIVLRGPKCAKQISPTHYTTTTSLKPLRQGRMDPCFHVLYAECWPYHLNVAVEFSSDQATFFLSSIVQFCEPVWIVASVPVLSWQERNPVWSSAASGFDCCAFRDGYSAYLGCNKCYLSYCCLSIISNQSAHSPLTSKSTRHFVHTIAAHWIFSLFRTILCKTL